MQISRCCKINILISFLFAILILCQPVSAQEHSRLVKLADNVYSYIDAKDGSSQNSFGANTGVIIGDEGIAIIDSRISAIAAQRLIHDIREISDKPIKYVINTHRHLDHAFGNCEFAKLGATIISSTIDKEDMKKFSMEETYKFFGVPANETVGTTIAYPNLSFNNKMEIDLGNQKLELIYPGPSHTAGSILVYLADKKLLFTGDILVAEVPFMGDANIPGWIKSLDYIMAMDVEKIVPGHGALSTKQDVVKLREYISLFDQKAKEFCSKSSNLTAITDEMKKVLPYREGDAFISVNIALKYLKKIEYK